MFDQIVRRLQMMIGRGRINTVNDSGPVQLVQVTYSPLETKDNIPRVMEYGLSSNPPSQTDAALVHITGDRTNGLVVGTNHQASRPKNLGTGEVMLYQLNGIQLFLSNEGLVINAARLPVVCNNATDFTVNCTGKFKVVAPGGVEFDTPLVSSTGDMLDNSATNPHTAAASRGIFNGHGHPVPGVQIGLSTVTTNPPNETE